MFTKSNTSSSTGRRQKGNYITVAKQLTALQMEGTLPSCPLQTYYRLVLRRKIKNQIKLYGYCAGGYRREEERKTTRNPVLRHEKGTTVLLLLLLF